MNQDQAAKLRQPFDKQLIGRLPKGGAMLDFVGHAATTDRLLQVDPAWTWEPFSVDEHGLPAIDAAGNLWIKLTICGVTRPGVGDGKNMKERIGDAIRNAAMRFGVALDLWAKEDLHAADPAPVGPPPTAVQERRQTSNAQPAAMISEAQLKKMGALMREQNMTNRDEALAWIHGVIGRQIGSRNELTKADANAVITALVDAQATGVNLKTGEFAQPGLADDPWPRTAEVPA